MALSDILAAMDAEAAAQVEAISASSRADGLSARRTAEADVEALRERSQQEMQTLVQQERARRLNRARLNAIRSLSHARESLFAEALATARNRLGGLRSDARYADLLYALAREALADMEGEVVLHADPRDEVLLRKRFPEVRIAFDLEIWGGFEARTPDERIVVVNTLEARLEKAEGWLRQQVMPLFEAPPPDTMPRLAIEQAAAIPAV